MEEDWEPLLTLTARQKQLAKASHDGQMRVWISDEAHRQLRRIAKRRKRGLSDQLDLIIEQYYRAERLARCKARDRCKKRLKVKKGNQ